jgi:serine/threonine protein kinase
LIVTLTTSDNELSEEYEKAGAAACIIKDENFQATLRLAVNEAFDRIIATAESKTPFLSEEESDSDEMLSMLAALEPEETILHYRIVQGIGEGGMGEVYKAQDSKLGRTVAIKALPLAINNNSGARSRFLREAQSASKLNHPGIVTIHAIEEVGESQFIVMEYVEQLNGEKVDPRTDDIYEMVP